MPARASSLVIPVLVFSLAGCGYHFASSGTALPSDAQTIYVARFGNRTRDTGINDRFMRYVNDEIARHDRLKIVDSPTDADLELSGDVVAVNDLPAAFNSVLEPTIYSYSISVSATLKDLRTDRVLWAGRMTNPQQAPVVAQAVVPTTPTFLRQNLRGSDVAQLTDIQTAQTQTASAADLAMTQVAQNLYASMAEGF